MRRDGIGQNRNVRIGAKGISDAGVSDARAERAASDLDDILTIGAEEEFLLVDGETGQVAPLAEKVHAAVDRDLAHLVQREFLTTQIELATPPTAKLADLRDSLIRMRRELCDAAERVGVRLVAIGTGALPLTEAPAVTDNPRFSRMARDFGAICPTAGLSACHVHVGVPDRELGVQVINHLRAWLPTLQAITVNSPFADGVDTGFASWRSVQWSRWPSVTPPPRLESAAHYDRVIDDLVASGAMFDENMLYWYARLSTHVPTVEVRIGDVCPTVDEMVLVAALTRALVGTAVDEVADRSSARQPQDWLIDAAHWRSGHDGLDGLAVDTVTGRARPAWELLDALVEHVRPVLRRHGDEAVVDDLLSRIRESGTGAARQRRLFAECGDLPSVVLAVADATRP